MKIIADSLTTVEPPHLSRPTDSFDELSKFIDANEVGEDLSISDSHCGFLNKVRLATRENLPPYVAKSHHLRSVWWFPRTSVQLKR